MNSVSNSIPIASCSFRPIVHPFCSIPMLFPFSNCSMANRLILFDSAIFILLLYPMYRSPLAPTCASSDPVDIVEVAVLVVVSVAPLEVSDTNSLFIFFLAVSPIFAIVFKKPVPKDEFDFTPTSKSVPNPPPPPPVKEISKVTLVASFLV